MHPRRDFLTASAALSTVAATAMAGPQAKDKTDADKRPVRLGVMGLKRGQALATGFNKLDGVEIAWVCDVDSRQLSNSVKQLQEQGGGKAAPKTTGDFRDILADPEVDGFVCAAPNHWHGPATIMACKAGKHVYVEKPCSHNAREGEWMIAAAKEFKRCVQMGSQRRSSPGTQAAISKLHSGAIGKVHLARCYYNSLRGPIGHGAEAQPPAELDYDLWQGPAPHVPYRDNVIPYNWHWFWHWGGGELANNGVHTLDLCRWGLNVDYPVRTVSSGGRYWYEDDQETPDVLSTCFEFEGGKQATFDSLSCNRHAPGYFAAFFGDDGALELDGNGIYRIYDRNNKEIEVGEQKSQGDVEHLQNFVDAIRADDPSRLNQPILEGYKSTLLCHLGNIAYRTGKTVITDPATGRLVGDDAEQHALWQREYEPSWVEAVSM